MKETHVVDYVFDESRGSRQGRKCRDISAIYRVSKGFDTIFHGEISVRQYFRIYREKSAIYHNISVIWR